jgi:hypothetical protein
MKKPTMAMSIFLLVFSSLLGLQTQSSMHLDYESAEAMMKVIQALHSQRGTSIVEKLLDEALKFKAYQVSHDRYTSPARSKENQVTRSQFRRFMLSFSGDQIDTQDNRRLIITKPLYQDAIKNPAKFQEALQVIKSIPSTRSQEAFRRALYWLPTDVDLVIHTWILFDIGGSGAWAFRSEDGAQNIGFNILHMLDESGEFDQELFLGILAHEIHHLGLPLSSYFKTIDFERLSETSRLRWYSDYLQRFVTEGMAQKFCNNAPGVLSPKPYPKEAFSATQANLKDWAYFQPRLADIHNRAVQDLRRILSEETSDREKFETDYRDYWTWAAGEKEGREFTLGRQYYYGSELVGVINAAFGREALLEGLMDLRKILLLYNRGIKKLRPQDFERYLFPEDIINMAQEL